MNSIYGFPSPAEDFQPQSLDLNQFLIKHPSATFFLQMSSDAMETYGLYTNDILIVDRSLSIKDDSIIVVLINGEFLVRKFCINSQQPKYSLLCDAKIDHSFKMIDEIDYFGTVTYVLHNTQNG